MQIRILGCSGGVSANLRTTSLLVDDDVLIDAGTGVGDLSLEEMSHIKHVFLTHSHLDHIASLPLLVDTIFDRIREPLQVHARAETIAALQQHIFNNVIWPDFSRLPSTSAPVMSFNVLAHNEHVILNGRDFEMIPVNHIVPGCGYRINSGHGVFVFSGDTSSNDSLWQALNAGERLDVLMVEAAFANKDIDLCRRAGHYCPQLLAADLAKLEHEPDIYISHTKPGEEQNIFVECQQAMPGRTLFLLNGKETFTL
ncbi:MAG: 3',5'-cyclic-nucleotide phosphodiesterase [Gammaproteobacteria bacterium]